MYERAARARPEPRPLGEFDFRIAVGAGNEDNVFRTAVVSYVDLADPNQPVVDPVIQSGTFSPLALTARYSLDLGLSARRRSMQGMWFGLNYIRTERRDRHAGYLSASYRITSGFSLLGTFTYQDVTSNDTQLTYNRKQFALSVRWEQ